jgi:thiol:disulfide interchange protein DsbC
MKKFAYLISLMFCTGSILVLLSGIVSASVGCGTDCMKCHSITKDEVKGILAKLKNTDAKILNIQLSPVNSLWEVTIENNQKQKGLFYVDFSKKYVLGGQVQIIEVGAGIDKTKEKMMELNKRKISTSNIPLANALVLGDKNADKKIIVFTDPECPYCAILHDEMKKVIEKRKDIVFFIKLYPLKMHPDAYWKSKSIICNKSIQLLEDSFKKKSIPKPSCSAEEIDNNMKLAEKLNITSTPTLIMPDGFVYPGYLSAGEIIKLADSAKKKGGKK